MFDQEDCDTQVRMEEEQLVVAQEWQQVKEEQPPEFDIDKTAPPLEVEEIIAEYEMLEQELKETLPPDSILALEEEFNVKNLEKEIEDYSIEVGGDQNIIVLDVETQVLEECETYQINDIEQNIQEDELDFDQELQKEIENYSREESEKIESSLEESQVGEDLITSEAMKSEEIIIDQDIELEDLFQEEGLNEITEQEEITREEETEDLPDLIEIDEGSMENQVVEEFFFTELERQIIEEEINQLEEQVEEDLAAALETIEETVNNQESDENQLSELEHQGEEEEIKEHIELEEQDEEGETEIDDVSEINETKKEMKLLELEAKVQSQIPFTPFTAYLSREIAKIESNLAQSQLENLLYQAIEPSDAIGLSFDENIPYEFSNTLLDTEIRAIEKMLEDMKSPHLLDRLHTQIEEEQQQLDIESQQSTPELVDSLELLSQGPTLPEPPPYDFRAELEELEDQKNSDQRLLQSFKDAQREQTKASLDFLKSNLEKSEESKVDGKPDQVKTQQIPLGSTRQLEEKEKQIDSIEENPTLSFERTLVRKRSYSIIIKSNRIKMFEQFGFTRSKPITLTVHNINSKTSESYIRKMGKVTGKKDNRSMTLSLGSDIGDLYDFDRRQKGHVEVMKNKMEITLDRQNYHYRFIITPGIANNQKYTFLRAYTQVSDYITKFSTKEIPVLEEFGFKPPNNVLLNVYQKKPEKFLEQSVIRLGEPRKVGQKSYQIKLGLPQPTVKRYKFGDSRLVKFMITPNKMVLTQVRKDNPLEEKQDYNYFFTITPFKEKEMGISQKALEKINHYYAAYVGYEFERLGQDVLKYLFPKAQIYRQREHQITIKGEEKIIRPDTTILEPSKPMILVDFKKSIGAIRPRTLNYLRYYPRSQLKICVLEEFGQSWEEKHIKNQLNKIKLNNTEIDAILKRITVLHTSDIVNHLPREKQKEFETKFKTIKNLLPKDRLDALKNANQLTSQIIERLKELGVSQREIVTVNKPTRGILYSLQNLIILERLVTSDYETAKNLADQEEFIDKRMVHRRLRQLERLGLVKEKFFRVGLSNRHYFYYHDKKPPELIDVLEPLAVNGLNILMKENYIPEKKVDDKVLREIMGSHWVTALKISSVINEKKIVTKEDLRSDDNINIESIKNVLSSLQKIGAVNYYQIYRGLNDHKVVHFFTHNFPNGLVLSDQIKFLKPYQQTVLNDFKQHGVEIPELSAFNEWLGGHWSVAFRIYNLTYTKVDLPQSTDGTKILYLYDLVHRLNESSAGIREALVNLEKIGVLDKYSWFEKSYYFQLKGTNPIPLADNPLLPNEIQKPLRMIEKVCNIQFQDLAHLRTIMTRHWKTSLRIYNIMSNLESSYSGIKRQSLVKELKKYNIPIKNLPRYIKPLKDTGVLFTYKNGREGFYQLRF